MDAPDMTVQSSGSTLSGFDVLGGVGSEFSCASKPDVLSVAKEFERLLLKLPVFVLLKSSLTPT